MSLTRVRIPPSPPDTNAIRAAANAVAARLLGVPAHDLSIEVGRLAARRNAQLTVQRSNAGPVLPLSELRLTQGPIAAHQVAMRPLVAAIYGKDLRARARAGEDVLPIELDLSQAVEDVEVTVLELLAQWQQPLVMGTAIFRKRLALIR